MEAVVVERNATSVRKVNWQIEQATVYLPKGGGQGVLIPGNMILTAAHCVPCTSKGGMYKGRDRRYQVEFHGSFWSEQYWATPCFVDPVSDIAVLTAPHDRKRVPGGGFDCREDGFFRFCERTPITLSEIVKFEDHPVRVLARTEDFNIHRYEPRERVWLNGLARSSWRGTDFYFDADQEIVGGSSGGPIVDQDGRLIGVVTHAHDEADSDDKFTGWGTIARRTLPAWILDEINEWADRKMEGDLEG